MMVSVPATRAANATGMSRRLGLIRLRQASRVAMGSIIATVPVELMKAERNAVASISIATSLTVPVPATRAIQAPTPAASPVSTSAPETTKSAAIMTTSGSANPARACSGLRTPVSANETTTNSATRSRRTRSVTNSASAPARMTRTMTRSVVTPSTSRGLRSARRLCGRHRGLQGLRIVGDDAVDSEPHEAGDLLGIVHRPGVDREAVAARPVDEGRIHLTVVGVEAVRMQPACQPAAAKYRARVMSGEQAGAHPGCRQAHARQYERVERGDDDLILQAVRTDGVGDLPLDAATSHALELDLDVEDAARVVLHELQNLLQSGHLRFDFAEPGKGVPGDLQLAHRRVVSNHQLVVAA